MIKSLKLTATLAFFSIFMFVFSGQVLAAGVKDEVQTGAQHAAGGSSNQNLNTTVQNVILILSSIAGVVAVVMIIVAGFRYITSGGNEQSIASAKKTLVYALIGLVVAALAQVIARFVLSKTT